MAKEKYNPVELKVTGLSKSDKTFKLVKDQILEVLVVKFECKDVFEFKRFFRTIGVQLTESSVNSIEYIVSVGKRKNRLGFTKSQGIWMNTLIRVEK